MACQQFFLDGNVRIIGLDKITQEYGNEAWVNALNKAGETPLHIVARNRNLRLFRSMLPYYINIEATNKLGNTVLHILVDHKVEKFPDHAMQRIDLIHTLIAIGADINKQNMYGWTLVHFAAKHCHIEMLKFLKKNGADFDWQTSVDGTALLLACKHMSKNVEERKTIEFLINLDSNINAKDEEGYSALHYAAERCSSKTVIELLKHGADVHLRTKEHKLTPLHLAVKKDQNLAVVKVLLQAGVIVESHEIEELTPVQISVLGGSCDIVKYLIKNGADVNFLESNLQFTPLHLAIYQQRLDLFQLLVDNGADVNRSGEDGLTPLHLSSMLGFSEFTKALISHGARVNCYYNNQLTPLHLTSMKNHIRENVKTDKKRSLISKLLAYPRNSQHYGIVMDVLLRNEANPNALTTSGWNLLHFVAKLGSTRLVKLLYEHGANVAYRETNSGLTALHFALANNFKTIVENLVKAGADVNALTQNGQRPIHLALKSDCTEVVKLLIECEAMVDCKETGSQLSPSHLALKRNYRNAAEILINKGPDVNHFTSDGNSSLNLALGSNCVEVLNLLISHGANVNYKETHSQLTPLHMAMLKYNRNASEILINAGADVNARTRDGKSPIHLYLESNSVRTHVDKSTKILKLLIERDANVNSTEAHSQLTTLHLALYKKDEDAAKILIDAGADVNAQTRDGKSPLHLALETNCIRVLKPLILRGANVNHKETQSQLAPLHLALLKNQRDATDILINAGSDMNALTQNGLRPIHLALLSNCTETLKLLLDNGAYVDGKEIQSQLTPLHLALYKNYRVAAEILINARADVNALTLEGKSPLHLALESNCVRLSKVLIELGATLNCEDKRCLYTLSYIVIQQNDIDMIDELIDSEKSLLFQAVSTQEDREIKKAIFRLCALVDAFNKRSCMALNPEVDKCCIENSAFLHMCGVDFHDFEVYSKLISYRVLSGAFNEFSDCQTMNEKNTRYLSNYLTMLSAVKLPLTCNYEAIKPSHTSLLFTKHNMRVYNQKCLDEVEKLKGYSVNDGLTLYSILHMRSSRRRFYTKHLELFEIESQFEIYYKLILASFYEDKIKTLLMETVESAFYRLTNVHLPIPCIEDIFLDLGIVDIIATIEAAERLD